MIANPKPMRASIIASTRRATRRLFFFAAAFGFLVSAISRSQAGTSVIEGVVRDNSGRSLAGVSVRLRPLRGDQAEQHSTDSLGAFAFTGLKPGTYSVTASSGDLHSNEVTVDVSGSGASRHVDLALANDSSHAKAQDPTGIEFSDIPSFTIAAVTDWTAAGGHGSDVNLRTSEALNRETMRLKNEPGGAEATPGDDAERERHLKASLANAPGDFKTNEELGRFYLSHERYPDAAKALQTACQIDPANKTSEYELALALERGGDPANAQKHLSRLLAEDDRSDLHRLAGEVDESLGDPISAVREFERAVKEEPSEENYLAWGSELLLHRAIWQAKDVFESGVKAHPHSARLLSASGAALFGAALYQQSAQRLCEASDLNPNDAEPYLIMGKVQIAAPGPLPCIESSLKRFVQLQPTNPLANYYYAMAAWKQRAQLADADALHEVESYLKKAVEADPKCSSAYLQLGNVETTRRDYASAVKQYEQAIAADPQMSEAHYRLGVAYDRLGQKERASEEFKQHDQLEKEQAAAVDRQRREIKQFLVEVGDNQRDPAAPSSSAPKPADEPR